MKRPRRSKRDNVAMPRGKRGESVSHGEALRLELGMANLTKSQESHSQRGRRGVDTGRRGWYGRKRRSKRDL